MTDDKDQINVNWKKKAIELAEMANPMSWRKIARHLGQSKSSVSDVLRLHFHGYVKPKDKSKKNKVQEHKGAKVLFFDKKTPRKNRHFIIGDTQAKDGVCLKYHTAIGQYIADKQPDVIVHIGDFADLPSLSSYDKGKRGFEGRRLIKDLDACKEALRLLMQPIYNLQERQEINGEKVYSPRIVITLGNHEQRLFRMMDDQPEFDGLLGDDPFGYKAHGWEVFDFLTPAYIDGIAYIHFMPNPFSGKPYGGNALNILKNVGHSFVVGHKQSLDIAVRPIVGGKMQLGIINGACYPHSEEYKGNLGNNHFRGATMLSEVEDGYGDPMFVSLGHMVDRLNG